MAGNEDEDDFKNSNSNLAVKEDKRQDTALRWWEINSRHKVYKVQYEINSIFPVEFSFFVAFCGV